MKKNTKLVIFLMKIANYIPEIQEEKYLSAKNNKIYSSYIKRSIDMVLAFFLIVLLAPVFLVVSVLIILETGYPVFYRAERGGYKGKTFKIFKFRSMVKNADKIGGGTTALNDKRITKVGAFLRKTKLDEIPQLLNILKGDMSFIGPRPELLKYTEAYEGEYMDILSVRPGITDYSSIKFINLDQMVGEEDADEMYEKYVLAEKNNLRVKYVRDISFKTDAKIFFKTLIKTVEKAMKVIFCHGGKNGKNKAL